MELRTNRKGMLAMMDALMFVILLSMVVAGMTLMNDFEPEDPNDAKDYHEALFGSKVHASDLYPANDDHVMPLCDLVGAQMMTGEGTALDYCEDCLDALVPDSLMYLLTIEYRGTTATIGERGNAEISSYTETFDVARYGMTAKLSVYR